VRWPIPKSRVQRQSSLVELKSRFTSAPILILPDPARQLIAEVDASDTGIGAVVVPLVKMLEHTLQEEMTKPAPAAALEMGNLLIRQLREKLYTL